MKNNKIKDEKYKRRNKSMNSLIHSELSSNIMETNINENRKINNINSINYNFYYQNYINFNNNKNQDNISNNFSSSTKNNSIDKNVFIKKKIKLKNLYGELFKENFVLIINEYGIENFTPLRKKYDGITKFGPNILENNDNIINDFQIYTLNMNIKTLFTIKYDNNKRKYYLISNLINKEEFQDLNIFIKLEKDLPILRKYYISLGKVNFSVEIKENNYLELKLYFEGQKKKSLIYDKKKKLIKIGRSKNCDIILKNLEYSRIQTSIYFNEKDKFWYIKDGFGDYQSMNGTWIFINFPWEISFHNKVKIGNNLFELSLI